MPSKMKHARRMVLVDADQVNLTNRRKNEDSKIAEALNTLVTLNKFSLNDYGSHATTLARLEKELDEALERTDLSPSDKLKLYDLKLQRFLFLLRENEKQRKTGAREQLHFNENLDIVEVTPGEGNISTFSPARASTSRFVETAQIPMTPLSQSTRQPHKTNLPRETPKERRLRTSDQRRKNSRYEGYLSNWDEYIGKN